MTVHETYMQRALQIAKSGIGTARPNPSVGAVIVYKNTIIGEGFTSPFGGSHAEVNAINSVKNQDLLKDSSIYVTLEPCSHHGKTPPCSDLLIKKGIKTVYIGCIDDNVDVAGKGIKKLEAAQSNVTVGILENDCKMHHKRFFTFHNKKRPYVILKWAESADGFLSPETKNEQKPVWISNSYSKTLVHKWRSEEQAILVGTNTVISDNPSLTTRHYKGQNPKRIVLDRQLRLHKAFHIFNAEADTIIIHDAKSDLTLKQDKNHLCYETINWEDKTSIAQQICDVLYKHQITSVIIEGGKQTLQTFIDENLWDEANVFTGKITFSNGTKAPHIKGELISESLILEDSLKIYKNSFSTKD